MGKYVMTEVRFGRQVTSGPFEVSPEGRTILSSTPVLAKPKGTIYAADAREQAMRRDDPEIDRRWTEIEAELERRRPGAILRGPNNVYYDFTGEDGLLREWTRLLDEANARFLARLPPLPVKEGDFVEVSGVALRVGKTDKLTRTVTLEQLDGEGAVQTSVPRCRADRLTPLAGTPDPAALLAPAPPPHMTDAFDRIRFRMRNLKAILREAGVWSDEPLLSRADDPIPRPASEVLDD